MNPFMNTNEASNNLHRKEQDATHKAAIGKLTEMVRAAQQSTLTELQAENAALKEQVAQLESDNKMLCESFSTASVNMKKTISTLARADLEATIAEQAKELTDLRLQCITDFGQYQEAHEKVAEQAKEIDRLKSPGKNSRLLLPLLNDIEALRQQLQYEYDLDELIDKFKKGEF